MMTRKKAYSTPVLSIHGTAEEITRMPPKTVGSGDATKEGEEVPYGKIEGAADAMDMHSRS